MRALEGIRVLDLSCFLPGALATTSLLRFGATVVKVERPGSGDPARHLTGAPLFSATNRGKRSVAIDLKNPDGKAVFCRLAEKADVLVESFRPDVMERFGLSYDTLNSVNSRLIYASLRGYDPAGPFADYGGHDINYMALSGMLDLLGPMDQPSTPRVQIADVCGGTHQLLIGILVALHARDSTGLGQRVDVSMISGLGDLLTGALAGLGSTAEGRNLLSGDYACYGLYRCKDDRWIAVGALEPHFWNNLCTALDCQELIGSQFLPKDQRRLKQVLSSHFVRRSAREWFSLLGKKDCCVTPVRSFMEAVTGVQFRDTSVGSGAKLNVTPGRIIANSVPHLGEHTREELGKLGIADAMIQCLEANGVVQSTIRPASDL